MKVLAFFVLLCGIRATVTDAPPAPKPDLLSGTKMYAAMLQMNREKFEEAFKVEKGIFEGPDGIEPALQLLSCAVPSAMSLTVRRMMQQPEFRRVVKVSLFNYAVDAPNTFYALASTDYIPGETNPLDDLNGTNRLISLLKSLAPSLVSLVYRYSKAFNTNHEKWFSFSKAELEALEKKHGKGLQQFLTDVAISILRDDYLDVYERINEYKGAFRNELLEIILKIALFRGDADLVELVHQLEFRCKNSSSLQTALLLALALPLHVSNHVLEMYGQFYDWDLVFHSLTQRGDIHTLARLSELVGPKNCAIGLFKVPIRLAQEVTKGNWRHLLVFMDMNPNRLILTDAAWNCIIYPSNNHQFLNFLCHMLPSNQ